MICRSGQGRRILVNEAEKRGLWTKINSRHALGGEGSKICQICRRIVLKKCRR